MRTSPALNGRSAIWHIECSDAIKIGHRMMFDCLHDIIELVSIFCISEMQHFHPLASAYFGVHAGYIGRLVPRCCKVRESAWFTLFTHVLNCHGIPCWLCLYICVHIRVTYHKLATMCQLACCSWKFYLTLFCLLMAGYLKVMLKNRLPLLSVYTKKTYLYAITHCISQLLFLSARHFP